MKKITVISGGQTGVDRGALDAAINLGIPHGGWCPKGRLAEDGKISSKYQLKETYSRMYAVRTRRNISLADATLIISPCPFIGGTLLAVTETRHQNKPLLVVYPTRANYVQIMEWLLTYRVSVLNVAGPRESEKPEIYLYSYKIVSKILQMLNKK
ncbi:MAG: putative molybdenum carrier protein [Pseudomonadota bacterium]|nr:putative molybdenum carrier protein [Pseudomonadota bacterium]